MLIVKVFIISFLFGTLLCQRFDDPLKYDHNDDIKEGKIFDIDDNDKNEEDSLSDLPIDNGENDYDIKPTEHKKEDAYTAAVGDFDANEGKISKNDSKKKEILIQDKKKINFLKKNITKVDWDLVSKLWSQYLDENIIKVKFDKLEYNLKKGIKGFMRLVFPYMISMATETKVSSNCSAGLFKWVLSLRELSDWSLKMFDSFGKPNPGILEGTITMFGNYHECIKIQVYEDSDEDDEWDTDEDFNKESNNIPTKQEEPKEFFRGKYCILQFKPWLPKKPHFYGINTKLKAFDRPKNDKTIFKQLSELSVLLHVAPLRYDICVPSICEKEDLQKIVNFLSKLADVRGRVFRCEVREDSLPDLSPAQIITTLCFIMILLTLTIITILKACICGSYRTSSVVKYLFSLSWISSCSQFCSKENIENKSDIGAVYGLRAIIVTYIVLSHAIVGINYGFFRDTLWLKDFVLSTPAQILTRSSYNFDALILVTAFTMAYVLSSKFSFYGMKYVIRKYFRVLPAVMITTGIVILLPLSKKYLRGGPTWGDFIDNMSNNCENNGLYNFAFMQNFLNPEKICLQNTWLLCVELQLAILFIPILIIGRNIPKSAWIILTVAIAVIGLSINIITVNKYNLPPVLMWTLPDLEQRNFYYDVHFFKPWTHLSVFSIGILMGRLCYLRKRDYPEKSPYGHYFLHTVGWIIVFAILSILIFSYNDWIMGILPSSKKSALFDGINRILLSSAMAFIMYALIEYSENNNEQYIIKLLKSNIMIKLGQLSLIAYIIHPVVQALFLATQQTHLFSAPIMIIYSFIGNAVVTYILSYIIAVFIDIPISTALKTRRRHHKFSIDVDNNIIISNNISDINENNNIHFNKSFAIGVYSTNNNDIEMTKHI